jgi:hypothetical protein
MSSIIINLRKTALTSTRRARLSTGGLYNAYILVLRVIAAFLTLRVVAFPLPDFFSSAFCFAGSGFLDLEARAAWRISLGSTSSSLSKRVTYFTMTSFVMNTRQPGPQSRTHSARTCALCVSFLSLFASMPRLVVK